MTASDWVEFRAGLALAGAGFIGVGISFAAQPPRFSIFIALLGLVMLLTLAPPRLWVQLSGYTFLMAGSVGLLSIALKWLRPPIAPEVQQDTAAGYLPRILVYLMFLALGWAERRHRARAPSRE